MPTTASTISLSLFAVRMIAMPTQKPRENAKKVRSQSQLGKNVVEVLQYKKEAKPKRILVVIELID
jgi:hypothetical protein